MIGGFHNLFKDGVEEELAIRRRREEMVREQNAYTTSQRQAKAEMPQRSNSGGYPDLKPPQYTKPSLAANPKDAVGVRKWRQFFCIPYRVMWEVGVGMLEGALKYGRFNYRSTGVQASIYIDASRGHLDSWCEGQDIDPDSGLSHITKAICSLIVLRDGMIEGNFVDDRAPAHHTLDAHTASLQAIVDGLFDKYPDPVAPFTDLGEREKKNFTAAPIEDETG